MAELQNGTRRRGGRRCPAYLRTFECASPERNGHCLGQTHCEKAVRQRRSVGEYGGRLTIARPLSDWFPVAEPQHDHSRDDALVVLARPEHCHSGVKGNAQQTLRATSSNPFHGRRARAFGFHGLVLLFPFPALGVFVLTPAS